MRRGKFYLLVRWLLVAACMLLLTGCGADADRAHEDVQMSSTDAEDAVVSSTRVLVQVNGQTFTAVLADTAAAEALAERLAEGPLVLNLSDYGGFEKVGSLGMQLPTDDAQTQAGPGDMMLYQGDQIVFFYGTNSWRYTALGQIDDLDGWAEALGDGDLSLTMQLAE
ncbi:MAG: cyclophilin-like fold protein [Peptococcaceae bacterium]|nr:cyclophilin-like fold protein [Peptococcaceae bacterium]